MPTEKGCELCLHFRGAERAERTFRCFEASSCTEIRQIQRCILHSFEWFWRVRPKRYDLFVTKPRGCLADVAQAVLPLLERGLPAKPLCQSTNLG